MALLCTAGMRPRARAPPPLMAGGAKVDPGPKPRLKMRSLFWDKVIRPVPFTACKSLAFGCCAKHMSLSMSRTEGIKENKRQ